MLRPYAEAVPAVRAAFDEIRALPDDRIAAMGTAIGSLGMFLWDDGGRRDGLDRAVIVAREAGALQDLDTLLWVMSLAELWGGTVRARHGERRAGPRGAPGDGVRRRERHQRRGHGVDGLPA